MYTKLLVTVLALWTVTPSASALNGCNSDKNVRLQDGGACRTGRVEVCVNGQWRTVCADKFSNTDATIVCRELGFSDKGATRSTYYSGPSILYRDTICDGSEESLLNCTNLLNRYCYRKAGVSCQQPMLGDLRILGGGNSSAGRLEVFANNAWGTVCGDYWSRSDAEVACKQLGFSARGARAVRDGFRKRDRSDITPIWLDNLLCTGTERSLISCRHKGIGMHNCNHDKDSGIVCPLLQETSMEDQRMTAKVELFDTAGEVEMQNAANERSALQKVLQQLENRLAN